jgi:hypothetical protein
MISLLEPRFSERTNVVRAIGDERKEGRMLQVRLLFRKAADGVLLATYLQVVKYSVFHMRIAPVEEPVSVHSIPTRAQQTELVDDCSECLLSDVFFDSPGRVDGEHALRWAAVLRTRGRHGHWQHPNPRLRPLHGFFLQRLSSGLGFDIHPRP